MSQISGSMRGGRARKLKAEINVVPYIDVMLVLLVIFMVAAPMADPGMINLPRAEKSSLPPTEYVQITLQQNEAATLRLHGKQHANAEVQKLSDHDALVRALADLHSNNPDLPLMISADKDIKYDEVIKAISDAKKLGINRVGLATKQ